MPRPLAVPAAAAILLLIACDDGTSGEPLGPVPPAATFAAEVTGHMQRRTAGAAYFRADLPYSDVGTAFSLNDRTAGGATRHTIHLYRWESAALTPGEYGVVPPSEEGRPSEFRGGIGIDLGTPDETSCTAVSGVAAVRASSAARVAGTFTFVAECAGVAGPSDPARLVTVSGVFDAAAGSFGPGPNIP